EDIHVIFEVHLKHYQNNICINLYVSVLDFIIKHYQATHEPNHIENNNKQAYLLIIEIFLRTYIVWAPEIIGIHWACIIVKEIDQIKRYSLIIILLQDNGSSSPI
ncbi:hypothetical protein ACJX0J_036945, partial [Zea mays]